MSACLACILHSVEGVVSDLHQQHLSSNLAPVHRHSHVCAYMQSILKYTISRVLLYNNTRMQATVILSKIMMPASMRATPLSSFNTSCWYIHTRSHMTKVTHAERKENHTSALWGITSGLKPEATQVPHPVQTTTCFSTHFQCFPCIDMHQHCHRDSHTELEAHAN